MLSVLLIVTYAAAVGVSLYSIGWLLWQGSKTPTTASFILCQALIILWCFTQFFTFMSLDVWQKTIVYDFSYLSICFLGPAWLVFSIVYGGKTITRGTLGILCIPAVFHYLALFTNPVHHLFYPVFESSFVTYGPLFYTNAAVTYGYILSGVAILCYCLYRDEVNHAQMKAVILSVAIPLACNLLYLLGFIKPGFDITPPAFSATCGILLLATYRYNFLNVNTLASSQVFEAISEGLVIYNTAGTITYTNETALRLLGVKKGQKAEAMFEEIQHFSKACPATSKTKPLAGEEKLLLMEESRIVEMRTSHYTDKKGRMTAGVVIFSDVTKYYELVDRTKELAVSNEALAVEKERNRIAQEVHDTTGHTLTMIRSLLKMAALKGEDEKTEYLEEAQKLAADGIKELRCSINNLKNPTGSELLSHRLWKLAESVRELETEVCIKGEDGPKYSPLSDIVYECAREAVTNCLKYADATHMDLIVKFHEDSLDFYVFDNGGGCDKMIPGNGFQGMEARVKRMGGEFRTVSAVGEGFQITIKLPLPKGEEGRD